MLLLLFNLAAGVLFDRVNPSAWIKGSKPLENQRLTLTFAVRQQNLKELEQTVLRVSDPDSPDYGKHLSFGEVNELVKPSTASVDRVLALIRSSGGFDIRRNTNSDFVRATFLVRDAERLFSTEFFYWKNAKSSSKVLRALSYSVPDSVAADLDFVSPITQFPTIRSNLITDEKLNFSTTPTSLRSLYKVGDVEGSSTNHKQAVTAFLEQYFSEKDLEKFYEKEYPVAKGRKVEKIIGPNTQSRPGVEASLDIQYITALGANIRTEFWSFAGRAPDEPNNEPFLDWLLYLSNTTDAPSVFSTSYGEDEESTSLSYASRINVEFQKAAARGISLLFASGDSGVGADSGSCVKFVPQWPAASPWITSVGGTTGSKEVGAGLSSGGFSNRWDQPEYQSAAVATFLSTSTELPDASRYNKTGRAFPDVAAQATGFLVVNGGIVFPGVSGTSAASPTFAGVVSLLNDLRVSKGKSTLGFLNPLIYKRPDVLQDITSGNNPGCGTRGFTATKGWDPVTGYGTPDYQKMAQAVLELP